MKNFFTACSLVIFYFNSHANICLEGIDLVKNGSFEEGYLKYNSDSSAIVYESGQNIDFYSGLNFIGNKPDTSLAFSCVYAIGHTFGVAKAESFSCGGQQYADNAFWGIGYGGDANFKDHTSGLNGGGHGLIVDYNSYGPDSGAPDFAIAWEQKVAVSVDAKYEFSIWSTNYLSVGGKNGAFNLVIVPIKNGLDLANEKTIIAQDFVKRKDRKWYQTIGTWSNSVHDSVNIRIEIPHQDSSQVGVDFVFDDISFIGKCSPCANAPKPELVVNGDFEEGYLKYNSDSSAIEHENGKAKSFKSELNFVGNKPDLSASSFPCSYGVGHTYAVAKAENFNCGGLAYIDNLIWGVGYGGDTNFKDHTVGLNGKGHALLVDYNSFVSGSTPTMSIAWEQQVAVNQYSNYDFSLWSTNFLAAGGKNGSFEMVVIPLNKGVEVSVERAIVASDSVKRKDRTWNQTLGSWTNTNHDSILIRIEIPHQDSSNFGIDFIFDDISFKENCSQLSSTIRSKQKNEIKLYPNPAKDIVYFSQNIDFVELYHSSGQLIKTKLNTNHLNIGELSPGLYLIKLDGTTFKLFTK